MLTVCPVWGAVEGTVPGNPGHPDFGAVAVGGPLDLEVDDGLFPLAPRPVTFRDCCVSVRT
ncbi:MAG: hypothetical protein ABEL51_13080 [Salinibacter sp.]